MFLLNVAAAVLNQTPLDWRGNAERISGALAQARRERVSVICLPELCISGYGCEDAFHSSATAQMAWQVLQELLPETRGLVVSVGLPVQFQNAIFNCAALVVDEQVVGLAAKQYLAGDGIHYEPRWFKPWPAGTRATIKRDGQQIPIGDLLFEVGGVRIGFEICEDAWVATRPGGPMSSKGIDIIFNPSASHFAFDKREVRRRYVVEGSRAFNVSYIYANLLGNESGRAIYDGGGLIASRGKLLRAGPRFGFEEFHITAAQVDLDETRMAQARMASYKPAVGIQADDYVSCPFRFPEVPPQVQQVEETGWEASARLKEQEFSRAVALALYDYLRKSRLRGFVVSLSGGADSTAVAVLCHLMVRLGVESIGREAFLKKLKYIEPLMKARTEADIIRTLLICVYQATANSGPATRRAAATVAKGLGAQYFVLEVEEIRRQYVELIERCVERDLTWEQDDVALQNIQSRVRAPSVWLLANIKGALLLSTSNRSEAAVGYATMDGDTAGGLSPIAGIDKAFLRRWLQWMESESIFEIGPMEFLGAVNRLAPTAELRPIAMGQTDEADLMPYDLLDAVERAAIRDKKSPLEVLQSMRPLFPQYHLGQLAEWVERFFRLWCRNQWKRERYAPSFHLDDENLDPKTWCRFPILSGAYEREIHEMNNFVVAALSETTVADQIT